MAKELVIVESPAKARTISHFLGRKYIIKASLGHVRDLPRKRLGVDVAQSFAPKYVVPKEKRVVLQEIKGAAREVAGVYLATDPDREGEAIAWHLVQAVGLDKLPLRRVVFHELTKEAVSAAFHHPRQIDMGLVNAQQARRILDRLVGYKISPVLWRKVGNGLSAGRVQSVALRMIVDRAHEIESFVPVEYWTIEAELAKEQGQPPSFRAKLVSSVSAGKLELHSEEQAKRLSTELEGAQYAVSGVRHKKSARQPAAPFITSTLQQEAGRRLHFSAKRTMALAQQLYEGLPIGDEGQVGLITYMRTDSTRVSTQALAETRAYIAESYGADFAPPAPRSFGKKTKWAQEAHEAIRPTSVRREPARLKPYLTRDQLRLYQLIWKRMVASQMSAAQIDTTIVEVAARTQRDGYLFEARNSVAQFSGFLILYGEGGDEAEGDEQERQPLPALAKGDKLCLLGLFPEQHFTQPPPHYTEATLIKALEENGIGRPSTYAPILSTIQDRGYVQLQNRRFKPLALGLTINDLLTEHFPDIVDVEFTAQMEQRLDEIAQGRRQWVGVLEEFYTPFEESVATAATKIPQMKIAEPTDEFCEKCGLPMVIKLGRYGKFLSCSGFPQCKNAKPLLVTIGVDCPKCGAQLVERRTKRARLFYGCAKFPACDFAVWDRPLPQPCPKCGGLLTQAKNGTKCTQCGAKEGEKQELAAAVE